MSPRVCASGIATDDVVARRAVQRARADVSGS
jgi:hypothetical protein